MKKFLLLMLTFSFSTGNAKENLSLSYETDLLARIRSLITKDTLLQVEALRQLPLPICGTSTLLELKAVRQNLALPEWGNILGVNFQFPRPTYTTTERTYDTPGGFFKIHYVTTTTDSVYGSNLDINPADGHPDYVNRVGAILDTVWNFELGDLGYDPPPSDSWYVNPLDNGGDGKYDVYLQNLPTGFLGYAAPETTQSSSNWTDYTSFLVLRTSYNNPIYGYTDQYDGVRVTAAHEFFHSIQFGYDATEQDFIIRDSLRSPYWMEISAVWMEDQVYDQINDYLRYLSFFYDYPWLSLKTYQPPTSPNLEEVFHPYASCVWAFYLTENYDRDIIKAIWEGCAQVPDGNVISATDSILQVRTGRVTDLTEAFRDFTVWNYFTGGRANPYKYYSEGDLFKCVLNDPSICSSGEPIEIRPHPLQPPHSSYPASITPGQVPEPPEIFGANYAFFSVVQGTNGGLRIDFTGQSKTWRISALGYPLCERSFFVNDSSRSVVIAPGWKDFSEVVLIPALVDTMDTNDIFFKSYAYTASYDSTLTDTMCFYPQKERAQQSAPNPFVITGSGSKVYFPVDLNELSDVTVKIFTLSGDFVTEIKATLPRDSYKPGMNGCPVWDGKNKDGKFVASGVYLVQTIIQSGSKKTTKVNKMAVIRKD